MNAAEPVPATPNDGHARGIVDKSSSAQQLGAVGIVRQICYSNSDGPNQKRENEHPEMYVVVKFPLSIATQPMIPGKPTT